MSEFKAKSKRYGGGFRAFFFDWMILLLFVVLVAASAVTSEKFRTVGNIMNVLRQASFISIIAMGEFFVILTGQMDMSISSTIGMTSIFFAGFVVNNGIPLGIALVLVLLMAVVVGLINGALTVYGKMPSFIATLVVMNVLKGIYYIYSKGLPISGVPTSFNYLGAGYIGIVPFPVIMMLLIAAMLYVITVFAGLTVLLVVEQSHAPHLESASRFLDAFFEVASALGTVGLSMGITPYLSAGGRLVVILLMFIGRLGPISVFAALSRTEQDDRIEFPGESVLIG